MQPDDRRAFDAILAEMFAAIDKPLGDATREAFWKGLQRMSIMEFSRCKDLLYEDLQAGERPRNFGVSNVWALKGRMRASAPTPPTDDGWRGDDWDQRANLRLLSKVLSAGKERRYYDARQTRILVAMKNRWAELMRRAGDFDAVPMDEQDDSWRACMRMAEAEFLSAAA